MDAIEGTINDLMIHSQFDSNTHMEVAGSSCCLQNAGGDSTLPSYPRAERGGDRLPGSLRLSKAYAELGDHRGHVLILPPRETEQSNKHFWGKALAPWWRTVYFTVCAVACSKPTSRASKKTKISRKDWKWTNLTKLTKAGTFNLLPRFE